MKVDSKILEKEAKYIGLKLQMCTDLKDAHLLYYSFEMINNMYEDITGKRLRKPKLKFIKEDDLLLSYDFRQDECNNSLLEKFEQEKDSLVPLIKSYLRTFYVDSDEDYEYNCKQNTRIYSQKETQDIILEFFSRYGDNVYNIVKRLFDNKQIHLGFQNGEQSNDFEAQFEEVVTFYGDLDDSLFVYETLIPFVNGFREILDEVDDKYDNLIPISDEEYLKYIDKLHELYIEVEMKDGVERPVCPEHDDIGLIDAYTYSFPALKKSYVAVVKEKINPDTLISIVHELGHVVDDTLQDYDSVSLDNNNYYIEFLSSYVELDFIKFMQEKEPEEKDYDDSLLSYYCETADDLTGLVDTIGSECQHNLRGNICGYITKDGENISVNVLHRVKYGIDKLMVLYLYNLYKNSPQEFLIKYSEFIKNSKSKNTVELLSDFGVPMEEVYKENPNKDEILSLAMKYN